MNELTRQRLTGLENGLMVAEGVGKDGEGIVREFGMDMYILLYLKWITNKDHITWNCSVMWEPGWKGSLGENGYMCTYG